MQTFFPMGCQALSERSLCNKYTNCLLHKICYFLQKINTSSTCTIDPLKKCKLLYENLQRVKHRFVQANFPCFRDFIFR